MSGAAAVRMICEARDGSRDFVGKSVGGRWVAFSDILELPFEIALRGPQPDERHRPRLRGLPHQFATTRLPLPHDLPVRNQFHVRIIGFFQALFDLRSKPDVVLGAFDIISS